MQIGNGRLNYRLCVCVEMAANQWMGYQNPKFSSYQNDIEVTIGYDHFNAISNRDLHAIKSKNMVKKGRVALLVLAHVCLLRKGCFVSLSKNLELTRASPISGWPKPQNISSLFKQ